MKRQGRVALCLCGWLWLGSLAVAAQQPAPAAVEELAEEVAQGSVPIADPIAAPIADPSGDPNADQLESASSTVATAAPPATGSRTSPGERYLAGVAASEQGNAEEAIEAFAGLLEDGLDDGRLYYNLANAQLRSGRLGAAVASYRRALERRPRDGDIVANLAFARRAARDAIAPPTAPVLLETLAFWHFWLAPGELRWLLVAVNALAWGLAGWWLVRRRGEVMRWLLIGTFAVTALLAASVVADLWFAPRVAVIVPAAVDVVAGPAVDAVLRFELHAGAEVRLIESRDGWLRVSLPDGQQGWLPTEAAEVVRGWRG